MSLLKEAMTPCVMIVRENVPDGYGGYVSWDSSGVTFEAAIVFDTSIQARLAEAEGVMSRYTVTTGRNVVLKFHDVFRRESDGKIFRVTSDGDDRFTPASAPLDMRQVSAEEWKYE